MVHVVLDFDDSLQRQTCDNEEHSGNQRIPCDNRGRLGKEPKIKLGRIEDGIGTIWQTSDI